MSYIQPDKCHQVGIEGGELLLSPAYDTVHHFKPLDFGLLKYWNQESGKMHNIALDAAGVEFLTAQCQLPLVEREFITEHEHEIYVTFSAQEMTEADFGLEFNGDDV